MGTRFKTLMTVSVALVFFMIIFITVALHKIPKFQIRKSQDDNLRSIRVLVKNDSDYENSKTYSLKDKCSVIPESFMEKHKWIAPDEPHKIYVMDQHKFSFCQIKKVGSQFWSKMAGFLSDSTSNYKPKQKGIQDIGESYRSAMFVRDPWSRLWSAYNDKYANIQPLLIGRYYEALREVIGEDVLKTRDSLERKCLHNVSYSNFIDLIIYQYRHRLGFDGHWEPFWTRCNYCEHNYDFIGRLENMKDDFQTMITKFGLGDLDLVKAAMKPSNYSSQWVPVLDDFLRNRTLPIDIPEYPEQCKSLRPAFAAKWRALINQGYVHHDDPMPDWYRNIPDIPPSEMDPKTLTKLVKRARKEIRHIGQSYKYSKQQQKMMHMAMFEQAMSVLTQEQLCTIEFIYKPDFVAFDYKMRCKNPVVF